MLLMAKKASSKRAGDAGRGGKSQARPQAQGHIDVVTGATSGLGIALVKALLDMGDEVRVIIIEHPSTSEDWKQLPPRVIPYIADLTLKRQSDYKNMVDACRGADRLFHLAASTHRFGKQTLDDFIAGNVVGTENVLKACVEANPGGEVRFVYASTIGVYGSKRKGEVLTEESDTSPKSPYTESKLMGEQVVKSFAEVNSTIKYTIARIATIYGPGYEESFFRVLRRIRDGTLPNIGKGLNHLALVHVNDVVRGLVLMASRPEAVSKVYNLSGGDATTLASMLEISARALGVRPPSGSVRPVLARFTVKGLASGEIDFLLSDRIISIDKIKRDLGFKPQMGVNEGVGEMVSMLK